MPYLPSILMFEDYNPGGMEASTTTRGSDDDDEIKKKKILFLKNESTSPGKN